ncbi:hypothetical protein FKM82_027642, partial [Ascaphus truei]
ENILKTAKALVEDTKLLVSGAASSQEKLAQAAQSSAHTITQLAEVVKLGAASLGSEDPETQLYIFLQIRRANLDTVFQVNTKQCRVQSCNTLGPCVLYSLPPSSLLL